MTKKEWLECIDPSPMLDSLIYTGDSSDRKLRLFAVASCFRIWNLLSDTRSKAAVIEAERLADDPARDWGSLFRDAENAEDDARRKEDVSNHRVHRIDMQGSLNLYGAEAARYSLLPSTGDGELCWWAHNDAASAAATSKMIELLRNGLAYEEANRSWQRLRREEWALQADLLRDIFGNPFRPIALDGRWLTSNVVDLAGAIYNERAFDRMPILADALMDAGCDSEEIINHCRGDGPHARGCWVVDLILRKE